VTGDITVKCFIGGLKLLSRFFFSFQGLKGERGNPGTAGHKGESVRMICLNNVKLTVSRLFSDFQWDLFSSLTLEKIQSFTQHKCHEMFKTPV